MAKQIISLGTTQNGGTTITFTVAFWFTISSGQKALTTNSQWTGASVAENTSILAGTVLEQVVSFSFPVGTPIANIKAYLLQEWTNRNTQLSGVGPANTYGVFFDSVTGWSA